MAAIDDAIATIGQWVDDGVVRGASAAVWHRGEVIATHVAGESAPGRPVDDDTLFALASVSKPISVAAILLVLAREGVDLDTPLVDILPDFAEADDPLAEDVWPQLEALRDRVTLRQLLCHTSGLPENVGVKRLRMSSLPSLDTIVDVMCKLPLQSAPGEELRYSNAGTALAARAAARIDGRDFHTILQREILDAAELDGIATRPAPSLDERIVDVQNAPGAGGPSESYNSRYWRDLGLPWGGYFGTTLAVLRFASSFLPDQPAPLPAELRAEMIVDQTGGVPGGVHSAGMRWERGAWGFGWEVKDGKRNHWTGTRTSERTWCHWGQAGTLVWLDPDRQLAAAMFANRTVTNAWPLRPPRWATISDAIIAAMET
jgi:CubicO group peptidase (beta-lactamase class C family)